MKAGVVEVQEEVPLNPGGLGSKGYYQGIGWPWDLGQGGNFDDAINEPMANVVDADPRNMDGWR